VHISKWAYNAKGFFGTVKAVEFVSYFFSGPHRYTSRVF